MLSSASLSLNEQHKSWDGAGETQGSPGYPEVGPEKTANEASFLFFQPPNTGNQEKPENKETMIFLKSWKAMYLIFLVKSRMVV